MTRMAALLTLALSACTSASQTISRADADKLASAMFREYLRDTSTNPSAFAKVVVEQTSGVSGDGWWYRWVCRSRPDSALGIMVGLDGTADYSEAADCAGKR